MHVMADPNIHVTEKMFKQSVEIAREVEFEIIDEPKIFFSETVLVQKMS